MNVSKALLSLVVLCCGCGGGGDDESAQGKPWDDEAGAIADPGGTVTGNVGGLDYFAAVDVASFNTKWSSFVISAGDYTSHEGQHVGLTLSIDRDLVGVGEFDCAPFPGEASISGSIPTADQFGGTTQTHFSSNPDHPCTITISSFGQVGQPITGSFGATLTTGEVTTTISGTINATRGSVIMPN